MSAGEPTKIIFGTDGWRAKIGDEFTYENVRRLAEGVARVVEQDGTTAKGVVIAYDRRFGSEDFAVTAADDQNVTAIWAHLQSSASDDTVTVDEMSLLAIMHTIGGEFGYQNFLPEPVYPTMPV